MKLVIADEARDELARIGERIARDNPRRAVAFVDEIESHCHRISATPLTHPLLPGREATRLRRAVHGNYLLFSIGSIPTMSLSSICFMARATTTRSCFPMGRYIETVGGRFQPARMSRIASSRSNR
jgi:toxin ParE1/3/4